MDSQRQVLIVETDDNARSQMKGVLAAMSVSVAEACGNDEIHQVAEDLERNGTHPDLLIVRVTLPGGSGIQVMNDLRRRFPAARRILVSHFAKSLLYSIPDFGTFDADFLQAEFTDEQFRRCVERLLAKRRTA